MRTRYSRFYIAALLMLSACSSKMDMQGVDPNDYYAQHPVENKVAMQSATSMVRFAPKATRLAPDEVEHLQASFRDFSPMAVDSMVIRLSSADMSNAARREHLTKLLHNLGYEKSAIRVEQGKALNRDEVQVDVIYSVVVLPDCPDWKRSPVTTYSNTTQGNYGCANTVNLGLMVADPHDLLEGSGNVTPDSVRSAKVLTDYHSNVSAESAKPAGPSDAAPTSTGGSVGGK